MKYGWEIADEVQRFVGDSADMQFVPYSEYKKLEERLRIAVEALAEIDNVDDAYYAAREALEKIQGVK